MVSGRPSMAACTRSQCATKPDTLATCWISCRFPAMSNPVSPFSAITAAVSAQPGSPSISIRTLSPTISGGSSAKAKSVPPGSSLGLPPSG